MTRQIDGDAGADGIANVENHTNYRLRAHVFQTLSKPSKRFCNGALSAIIRPTVKRFGICARHIRTKI